MCVSFSVNLHRNSSSSQRCLPTAQSTSLAALGRECRLVASSSGNGAGNGEGGQTQLLQLSRRPHVPGLTWWLGVPDAAKSD